MTPPSIRTGFGWLGLLVLGLRLAVAAEGDRSPGLESFPLAHPGTHGPGFTALPADRTGIAFTNRLAENRALTNQIYLNGSGVAAGDVNGDGRCDLYFCGLDSPNALYLNLGDWRFEDGTATAGVGCADQASTGAALADLDGDGDLDLVVNAIDRGTRIFLNDGQAHFREITATAGLGRPAGGMSLALADVDGDGDLDLYVVNYRMATMRDEPEKRFRVGVTNGVHQLLAVDDRPATAAGLGGRFSVDPLAGVIENGEPDALFLNDGSAHFTRVDWTGGAFLSEDGRPVATPFDWGLSAMFCDVNNDQAPDLYVCNDFQSPDRFWLNDGRGHFHALPRSALRQTSLFSMGVDFADVDRDGWVDFFVADMLSREHVRRQVQVLNQPPGAITGDRPQFSRNTLLRNRGDGTFAEIARLSGVEASEWSWCPAFVDVDLDGYEDLLLTTGHGRDAQNADVAAALDEAARRQRLPFTEQLKLRRQFAPLHTPNVAFRNRGDLTFEDLGPAWGFDSRRISQGLALADLDQDGDLDVVINCLNDGPLIYRNEGSQPRVAVRLRGRRPNTHGIGARVNVTAFGLPRQSQEFISGGRYLSSDDSLRVFAAGSATNTVTIEVTWRSGLRRVWSQLPANRLFELDESAAVTNPPTRPPRPIPWFTHLSGVLRHPSAAEPFDDFARQPLLPRSLSQQGPGVTWFDFNGDGWDDLIISASRNGQPTVFRNDTHGGFVLQKSAPLQTPAEGDLTSVLGWRPDPASAVLLMGMARHEDGRTNRPGVRQFNLTTGTMDDSLPVGGGPLGPLALGSMGEPHGLQLFVGGGAVPGRYPEAAPSFLFRSQSGHWEADPTAGQAFQTLGVVTDALFCDLDDDGQQELLVATDWGPLHVFKRGPAGLVEWVPAVQRTVAGAVQSLRLENLTGQWNSVAVGDFDQDGRMDIVAGNWGRNTRDQRYLSQPLTLQFGPSEAGEGLGLIEAHWDPDLKSLVPARDWATLSQSFPRLRERYAHFTAFSTASIPELEKSGLPPLRNVTALTLDSLLFLNRGDHLEAHPLPLEAQVSPVFGLAVGDLDGDGNDDVFLAQNFFGVSPAESRYDAGLGVVLRGDGKGGLTTVTAAESGIRIDGEGRGAALDDFDHDGRLDLAVGQFRGATQLYRNATARPGLRLQLKGPPQNPLAIGARVRLIYRDGRRGPAHERTAGGGHWSQEGAEVVLGLDPVREPEAVEIRWPPGTELRRVPLAAGARELQIRP